VTKRRRSPTLSNDADFVRFAKRATAGIDSSGMMLGLLDGGEGRDSIQWYTFALQVGRCLLDDKPLILVVPTGSPIPDKLKAAATGVEYYTRDDLTSCELATKRALETLGFPVRH